MQRDAHWGRLLAMGEAAKRSTYADYLELEASSEQRYEFIARTGLQRELRHF